MTVYMCAVSALKSHQALATVRAIKSWPVLCGCRSDD